MCNTCTGTFGDLNKTSNIYRCFQRTLRLKEDLDSNWKAGHNAFLGPDDSEEMTPLDPLREGKLHPPKTNMDTYNIDEDVKASSGNLLNYWVGLQLSLPFKTHFHIPNLAQANQVNEFMEHLDQ